MRKSKVVAIRLHPDDLAVIKKINAYQKKLFGTAKTPWPMSLPATIRSLIFNGISQWEARMEVEKEKKKKKG